MNWTGGNLSRVSKGTNKSSVQRQKGHFAKVRKKLQDGTTMGAESITKALAQLSSGRMTHPQSSNGKQSYHDNPTTVSPPPRTFKSSSTRNTIASHASTLESGGTGELVIPASSEHGQSDDSRRQHIGFSVDMERRRLLEGRDWLGLEVTKPLEAKFSKVRKEQVDKRKKLRMGRRPKSRSPMYRPLQSCTLPVEAESMRKKGIKKDVVLVKIGSHALLADRSSSIKPDSLETEHSQVKVDTSTKYPYGIGFAPFDLEMDPEARTARRQLAYSVNSCRRSVSSSIVQHREAKGARTLSPNLDVEPGILSRHIGLSKTQNEPYNVLLHRDVTNQMGDAEFTDSVETVDSDKACIPTSASASSLPSNAVTIASQNRFSIAVPDAGAESQTMQQIHSDEVVVGGKEGMKGLMEMGMDCKRTCRSNPDGRVERDAWDCTLQDHRERAQSSSSFAITPPSRLEWSNLHTRLETSSKSFPRHRHLPMNGVEGISKPGEFPGQTRLQLQDQSIDLWERFIFGSKSPQSPSNYSGRASR